METQRWVGGETQTYQALRNGSIHFPSSSSAQAKTDTITKAKFAVHMQISPHYGSVSNPRPICQLRVGVQDISKGKVLFYTGGGSGTCKEMTYAMVCCYSCLRLCILVILSQYPDDTMPTQQSSEEIWCSLHFPFNVSRRVLWGVDPKSKHERDPPFRHHQTWPQHTPSSNPLPDVRGPQVIEPHAPIHFHRILEVVCSLVWRRGNSVASKGQLGDLVMGAAVGIWRSFG